MLPPVRSLVVLFSSVALAACAMTNSSGDPQGRFLAALRSLCGNAYEGRVVTSDAADRQLAASRLVMHVRSCSAEEVRIPFHAGEDRSRTWVISRTESGLRLKHDHRHEDGSEDVLTQSGGDTVASGSARRQVFPADAFSRELFVRRGIAASTANVWAVEVEPGRLFAYELRRPDRHFRVEFDLSRPVPAPPPPWGADG
jgi:CHASE1-domain containing sensor protein